MMKFRMAGLLVAIGLGIGSLIGCGGEKQQQPQSQTTVPLKKEDSLPSMLVDTIASPAASPMQREEPKDTTTEQTEQSEMLVKPLKKTLPEALGTPEEPLVGTVVDLAQVLTGGKGEVSREQAQELVQRGQPLAVLAGEKLYLVYHPDGSYAGEKLARFAGHLVGIVGQIQHRGGWNIIIADHIESMR